MINAVRAHVPAPCSKERATLAVLGVLAALTDVPDVEPFAFAGYPDNPVYLHATCGTVVDVSPAKPNDTLAQIDAGECDCENTSPWKRIYVERETGE